MKPCNFSIYQTVKESINDRLQYNIWLITFRKTKTGPRFTTISGLENPLGVKMANTISIEHNVRQK